MELIRDRTTSWEDFLVDRSGIWAAVGNAEEAPYLAFVSYLGWTEDPNRWILTIDNLQEACEELFRRDTARITERTIGFAEQNLRSHGVDEEQIREDQCGPPQRDAHIVGNLVLMMALAVTRFHWFTFPVMYRWLQPRRCRHASACH